MKDWSKIGNLIAIIGLCLTVAIISATITYYFTNDFPEKNHKREIKKLNLDIEDLKNINIQLMQELENSKIKLSNVQENNQLTDSIIIIDTITIMDTTIIEKPIVKYVDKEVIKYVDKEVIKYVEILVPDTVQKEKTVKPYYTESSYIYNGQSFYDSITTASFWVTDIENEKFISGTTNFPGDFTKKFTKVTIGHSWSFSKIDKKYKFIISYIGQKYGRGALKVKIIEQ